MSPKPITWREAKHVPTHQRSISYARAFGHSLDVTVWAKAPAKGSDRITCDYHVTALVEFKRVDDGGFTTVARQTWPDAKPETIAAAKFWCETIAKKCAVKP